MIIRYLLSIKFNIQMIDGYFDASSKHKPLLNNKIKPNSTTNKYKTTFNFKLLNEILTQNISNNSHNSTQAPTNSNLNSCQN